MATNNDPATKMEALGRSGLIVSVCCGSCGAEPFRWTVQVLSPKHMEEFDKPFAANSFDQAIEIAEIECAARGWWSQPDGRIDVTCP